MPKLDFGTIKTLATQSKDALSTRDTDYIELDKMFLLQDSDVKSGDDIKKTISPGPRNKVLGAARILAASDPTFTVPFEVEEGAAQTIMGGGTDEAQAQSSKIEDFITACYEQSSLITGKKAHYLAAVTALLYDEVHVAVVSTAELAKLSNSPRIQRIAERTPILFEVLSPRICYPTYDVGGLSTHYSERRMSVRDVQSRFADAEKLMSGKKPTDVVTYCEWWDDTSHVIWVSEFADKPLLEVEHKLPRIPIASAIIEGNELFDSEGGQPTRQPFLYTSYKSGIWKRENLSLTAMYTLIAKLATSVDFIASLPDGQHVTLDFSNHVNILEVPQGADVKQLQRQTLDPALQVGLSTAQALEDESTMYRQALGEPLGANAPYSMVALLSQAGRIPLTMYQRMLSAVFSDAAEIALMLVRDSGSAKIKTAKQADGIKGKTLSALSLTGAEIPEGTRVEAVLDVELPQDERANMQTAQIAKQLGIPDSLVYEKFLHEGQADQLREKRWTEQAAEVIFQISMQQLQAQAQAQMQAQMQQMQQPQPQPGMNMGGMNGAAQSGLPLAAPVEPGGISQQTQDNAQLNGQAAVDEWKGKFAQQFAGDYGQAAQGGGIPPEMMMGGGGNGQPAV